MPHEEVVVEDFIHQVEEAQTLSHQYLKQINMVILIQDITWDLAFIIIEYIFHLILIKECFML